MLLSRQDLLVVRRSRTLDIERAGLMLKEEVELVHLKFAKAKNQ